MLKKDEHWNVELQITGCSIYLFENQRNSRAREFFLVVLQQGRQGNPKYAALCGENRGKYSQQLFPIFTAELHLAWKPE